MFFPDHCLGFVEILSLSFWQHLELPESGSPSPSCLYARAWGTGRLFSIVHFSWPLVHRRIQTMLLRFSPGVVKLTTSTLASCSSQGAASSLEVESCVLDVFAFKLCFFTPTTPPKSNTCLGGLTKHTHLLAFSFHLNTVMGKVCPRTFTHYSNFKSYLWQHEHYHDLHRLQNMQTYGKVLGKYFPKLLINWQWLIWDSL